MRAVVDVVLSGVLAFVAASHLLWTLRWFVRNGSIDYLLIGLFFLAFAAAVWHFDRHAEDEGWLVHHWWDD